jgi:hypothetical protein
MNPLQGSEAEPGSAPVIRSTATTEDYLLAVPNTLRLFLIYTLHCNFSCSHCLVSSSPARREKMDLEVARSVIDAATGAGIRVIYLTGGEVFLYFRELVELVGHVTSREAASVIETNGSWATTRETTLRKLRPLQERGLSCLALSIDHYHLEFGTLECSLRLIETAREVGLPCRVLVVASPQLETDKRITDALDERSIPYFYETVLTVGRGKDLGVHSGILQRRRCDSIGVTVLPDGDVLSCAGAYDGRSALRKLPLYAGNAVGPEAREVFERERGNLIARAIDEQGHDFLMDLLTPDLRQQVQERAPHDSLCGFCHKFLGNREIVEHLRAALAAVQTPQA